MPKFLHALAFGYKVFQAVEASGLIPNIKGVPVQVIDDAAHAAAQKIIDAHKANTPGVNG